MKKGERKRERVGARCTVKNIRDIPTRRLIGIEENRVLIPAEQEISRGGGGGGGGEKGRRRRLRVARAPVDEGKKKEKKKKSRVTNNED